MKAFITNFGEGWLCYPATKNALLIFEKIGFKSDISCDDDPDAFFDDMIRQGVDKGLIDSRLVFPLMRWQEQRLISTAEQLGFALELSASEYQRLMKSVYRSLQLITEELMFLTVMDDVDGELGRGYSEDSEKAPTLLVNAIHDQTYPLLGIDEEFGAGFSYVNFADDLWKAYQKAFNRKIEAQKPLNDFDRNVLDLA